MKRNPDDEYAWVRLVVYTLRAHEIRSRSLVTASSSSELKARIQYNFLPIDPRSLMAHQSRRSICTLGSALYLESLRLSSRSCPSLGLAALVNINGTASFCHESNTSPFHFFHIPPPSGHSSRGFPFILQNQSFLYYPKP